ncbi:hypothetical protein WICPIJ_006786 [Wickerhamomyces pijperi]|uniref:Uncharacterized protein n=1 Tax=Wickerhamomyces pijperi TaxID=599730 RepID=A0A9P8Q135_WICPI|nr:hypothetical protein WICPIJ_006786 [Wickerhamomyces pijperi]
MKFSQLFVIASALLTAVVAEPHVQQPLQRLKVKTNDNDIDQAVKQQPLFYSNGDLNLDTLYSNLDSCEIVQKLNAHQLSHDSHESESIIQQIFTQLFPFSSPVYNSLLATTYISTLPTLTLLFFSSSINPASLNLLVSFAAGGILGDCFFHLLPQVFLGESEHQGVKFVLVDERRNLILGVFIFVGFLFFFVIDKSLRILQHGSESSHTHSHADQELKIHKKTDGDDVPVEIAPKFDNSAYLNIISDFTHNITDGLAMSTSFYISKSTGSITCLGQVIHEIPHQVGDMALLIQAGFTKWQAIGVQFFTASGAFIGTFIGIGVQSLTTVDSTNSLISPGLFGTSVTMGDLTLPFTAGGFIYVATVNVIPEVLELYETNTKKQEIWNGVLQVFFIILGISMMFLVSWFE